MTYGTKKSVSFDTLYYILKVLCETIQLHREQPTQRNGLRDLS